MKILAATGNQGKVREIERLFHGVPIQFRSLRDFPSVTEVPETGSTFEENAVLKAQGYAAQTGLWALADDSGLEIAALGNAPGVLSARYGGDETGFDQKMEMLLREIKLSGSLDRSARFVCSMALSSAEGQIQVISIGTCEGTIANEPRGDRGFGYDPMFIPDGHEKTFAELTESEKGEISHRARASRTIIRYLLDNIAV